MDVTTLFKACVKTVRTRNKALSVRDSKTDILRKTNRDVFLTKAKEVLKQLTAFKDVLNENRKSYINVVNHFSTGKQMSDVEREELDRNAKTILQTCNLIIEDMKKNVPKTKSQQRTDHYNNVIYSLENYVQTVGKLYAEQKAVRIKRALDNRKIAKLELETPKEKVTKEESNEQVSTRTAQVKSIPDMAQVIVSEDVASAEELQLLEAENAALFGELSSVSEEVRLIEQRVGHIAQLQQQFTERVLQQERDIERVAHNVVGSTENVKDANQQIRQAIQRNAGLRVWVLFFLLVMSFTLLFLDWYND